MKRVLSVILCVAAVIAMTAMVAACNEPEQQPTVEELLDLGEKFLLEQNYEQALAHFLEAIEIEPNNARGYTGAAESYVSLNDAGGAITTLQSGFTRFNNDREYIATSMEICDSIINSVPQEAELYIDLVKIYIDFGNAAKVQSVLEMGFALAAGDTGITDRLLSLMIDNNDPNAVVRLVTDVQRINSTETESLQNSLLVLVGSDNTEFIDELIEVLYEQDSNSALALGLEFWMAINKDYESDDERYSSLNELFLEREESMPKLHALDERYVGEYDESGMRNGFGVCFYGVGAKLDSTMYIGYWSNNVRSGEGIAYSSSDTYIQGTWANDLPNGRLRYSAISTGYGTSEESEFADGLGFGEIHYYDGDRLIGRHNIPQTDIIQTFTRRPDIFRFVDIRDDGSEREGACSHVHMQWDVRFGGN